MRKVSQKTKFRVTFLTIGFIISIVIFGSTLFSYLSQINKLQDPEYVARRIREKHLYSGKNEIVIKIED